jgi:hypothetical protein
MDILAAHKDMGQPVPFAPNPALWNNVLTSSAPRKDPVILAQGFFYADADFTGKISDLVPSFAASSFWPCLCPCGSWWFLQGVGLIAGGIWICRCW